MRISVIIPTYNRKGILAECLSSLFKQSYSKNNFEIIVIDDGSVDETESLVRMKINEADVELRYLKQQNRGPAAARNLGIKNAKGEIILFIGDDIISSPILLEEHIRYHKQCLDEKVAVLGYVTWPPETAITPFMEWLDESGAQFGYRLIKDPENVLYRFFYTSNVSVKREFLLKHGLFDEDFPYAALEDIELAYRLKDKGLRIVYNKDALAYHKHRIDKKIFIKRSKIVGRSMAIFHLKHPELKEEYKVFAKLNLTAVIKKIIWNLPYSIEKIIPKKYLFASYSYMITNYIKQSYSE